MNIDTVILNDTINELKNNTECCRLSGDTGNDTGVIVIQESLPGEQLQKFISYLYNNSLFDMEYVENSKKLNGLIENYSYNEVITSLTSIIRGDRFISGHLYSSVKDGTFLRLLERLKEICV